MAKGDHSATIYVLLTFLMNGYKRVEPPSMTLTFGHVTLSVDATFGPDNALSPVLASTDIFLALQGSEVTRRS